jgi:membrane protease YdiL (CAAX protease family)
MFRGIGVITFRVNGFSERRGALWSSVVFGAAHLTNALSTGGTAVTQAIARWPATRRTRARSRQSWPTPWSR